MLRLKSYLGSVLVFGLMLGTSGDSARAEDLKKFTRNLSFDELTAAEHTRIRQEARTQKIKKLRVCADPGNMPLSSLDRSGYQNKIIELLAEDLGGSVDYFWRPYHERGLTRETFHNNECDILLDMPTALQELLTTEPIYKTTYVLATRTDRKLEITNLDDPKLQELKIGVFQQSSLREALVRHGIGNLDLHIIAHDADLNPEHQPWRQVQKVVDGELDMAGVWGPFAGWVKATKNAPINLQPVNIMEDHVPMEFELALGMQRNQVMLKYMLDWAISRKKDELAKLLTDFGVPLVDCSKCAVQGTLPSHGSYYERLRQVSQDRYVKQAEPQKATKDATADQVVTQKRVEQWLAEGADIGEELTSAITGNDIERVRFLISKGADVNQRDKQGFAPLDHAARLRNSPLIEVLADAGADVNTRDHDGFTPLMHAINRNHVPTVEMLAKKGAKTNLGSTGGIVPLTWALGDGKFYAAKALIEAGADVNAPSGEEKVTALMVVASQKAAQTRSGNVVQGISPIDLAKMLVERGADINVRSKDGVTPLMVAAGNNNPAMLALLAQSGADIDVKDAAGRTAREIAVQAGYQAAVEAYDFALRERGKEKATAASSTDAKAPGN